MRPTRARRALVCLTLVAGCKRAPRAIDTAPSTTSSVTATAPAPDETQELPATPQPRRLAVTNVDDEALLKPHAETLRAHFGARVPPLDVMLAPGIDGRVLMFLASRAEPPKQLLLVADRRRELLWQKERPLAGTRRGGRFASISGGPAGDVVVTWCDEGTGALAARKWEVAGGLMADYQLLPNAGCDSLTSLYWPGVGWVVVTSLLGVGRAQLLGENGAVRWGREGITIGRGFRTSTPHTLITDSDRSIFVLGYGYAELGAGDRAIAWRVSSDGRVLARLELGEAPKGEAMPPLDATQVEPGVVRVVWAGQRVDVTSDGQVRVAR